MQNFVLEAMIIISAIVRVIEQSIGTPSKPAQLAYTFNGQLSSGSFSKNTVFSYFLSSDRNSIATGIFFFRLRTTQFIRTIVQKVLQRSFLIFLYVFLCLRTMSTKEPVAGDLPPITEMIDDETKVKSNDEEKNEEKVAE